MAHDKEDKLEVSCDTLQGRIVQFLSGWMKTAQILQEYGLSVGPKSKPETFKI